MSEYNHITILNNAGFIKDGDHIFITRTTGEFLARVSNQWKSKITLFQFLERGSVDSGINNYKIEKSIFNLVTVPYYNGLLKLFTYLILMPKLLWLLLGKKQFVYIFYPGNVSYLTALLCMHLKIPYGLYVRGEYKFKRSKKLFKRAKFINTVGSVFKQDLEKVNPNCNIIKPMVQFNFSEPPQTSAINKINEILYVGRIESRKGIWDIVNACKRLKDILPTYKIRLVGSGKAVNNVQDYILEHGLDNVILNGPEFSTDKLSQLYLQAKIFLFPSHDEGFPRVLYEAMYFRLPIITTFVGNIPGIMLNEYNCLKIEPNAPDTIVKKIMTLIKDDYIYDELVLNASSTLNEVFNGEIKTHEELLIEGIKNYE